MLRQHGPARSSGRSLAFIAYIVPGTLRPQPQRQGGYLRSAWVNVHAVDVVFDDQARHVAQKYRLVFVGPAQWLERSLGLS